MSRDVRKDRARHQRRIAELPKVKYRAAVTGFSFILTRLQKLYKSATLALNYTETREKAVEHKGTRHILERSAINALKQCQL